MESNPLSANERSASFICCRPLADRAGSPLPLKTWDTPSTSPCLSTVISVGLIINSRLCEGVCFAAPNDRFSGQWDMA